MRVSREIFDGIKKEASKAIVGQEEVVEQLLITLLSDNHALLQGLPGLGKTMMIRIFSKVLDLEFSRIQCTPDVMPSDITGTYLIEEDKITKTKKFVFSEGPIFTNIVLADEINRATPKSQSALLECMQERQVTVGKTTFKLPSPFLVLATQNPIEMEGTYPLPEAQLDRFLQMILIDYPEREEEMDIVRLYTKGQEPTVRKILGRNDLIELQKLVRMIPIAGDIEEYAVSLVAATRPNSNNASNVAKKYIEYGASPRASISLILASKARALIQGRTYVSGEDIKKMIFPVLRHRLILNFEAEAQGTSTDGVINSIIEEVS